MSAPHPNAILLARGVLARLALWSTLRLAVHQSWGGPDSAEKQRWLAGVIVDQFEPFLVPANPTSSSSSHPPDEGYVEELLLQIMSDEFDVVLEDDSAATVARDIVKLFATIVAGDESLVNELEAQTENMKGTLPKYEINMGSGSEDEGEWEDDEGIESEDEPAPRLVDRSEPEVDEDGFIIVKKKGRQ